MLKKKNRRNFPKPIEDILKTLKSYCRKNLINQKTNSNSRFWLCYKHLWTLAGRIGIRKNSLKYLNATTVKPPKKKYRNVLTLCKIGFPAYSTLFHHLILTVLPKAVLTKLKFSKEMLTVTKISEVSETVFYIYFLIND